MKVFILSDGGYHINSNPPNHEDALAKDNFTCLNDDSALVGHRAPNNYVSLVMVNTSSDCSSRTELC